MTNTSVACSKKLYIMPEVTCTGSLLFWPITLDISCRQHYYVEFGWPTRLTPTSRKELYLTHGKELIMYLLLEVMYSVAMEISVGRVR
jgi:hypothetical protein